MELHTVVKITYHKEKQAQGILLQIKQLYPMNKPEKTNKQKKNR